MRFSVMSIALVLSVLALNRTVQADVSSYQASAFTSIVQFSGGVEQQRDEQAKVYPNSDNIIPIEAKNSLIGRNSDNQVTWTAFNRVVTNDPQYNSAVPRDFIMETAIGSADLGVSLKVRSTATQSRHINLLSTEFPDQNNGDPVNLVSNFSLQGALAQIVPPSASTAEGLQIKCNLTIMKNDTAVWDGTVQMDGRSDKTFAATTTGDFVSSDFVLAQNDIPDLARIGLLVFDTEIPFAYSGTVGESFDLKAIMDLEYVVPGGLGAGCAFGTVPSEMITLTQDLFGDQADPILNTTITAKQPYSAAPEPGILLLLLVGSIFVRKRR